MAKIYCQSCGSPTDYSFNKPKFCSECSKPFSNMPVVNQSNPVKTVNPSYRNIAHNEEEEEIPHLEKLDYRIEGTNPRRKTQIDSNGFQTEEDRQIAMSLARRNSARITRGNGKVQAIGIEPPDEDFKLKPIQKVNKGKKTSNKEILKQFEKEAGSTREYKNVGGE